MGKRLTTEEFIEKAKKIHGDKYDYSKVEYINGATKVCIICPVHGEFWQLPRDHIYAPSGCPYCNFSQKGKKIYGVGINDVEFGAKIFPKTYSTWRGMLRRCYDVEILDRHPTYNNCHVFDDWKFFSRFKEWYDTYYVEGWHLDKDILFKGNKIYSPTTCCFVPQEINKLFTKRQLDRGKFPIGVTQKGGHQYFSSISIDGIVTSLGGFNTIEDAFRAYKVAKEAYIKEVADRWKDKIEKRLYEALYNYKVEITD